MAARPRWENMESSLGSQSTRDVFGLELAALLVSEVEWFEVNGKVKLTLIEEVILQFSILG